VDLLFRRNVLILPVLSQTRPYFGVHVPAGSSLQFNVELSAAAVAAHTHAAMANRDKKLLLIVLLSCCIYPHTL
jgi:hypothetical protein